MGINKKITTGLVVALIVKTIKDKKIPLGLDLKKHNRAAKEVRVGFFLEGATPNREDKVKKTFDKALGVPVKWINYAHGFEMTDAMLAEDIDIAYSQGLAPFVYAVNAKAPITLVDIAVLYGMVGTTCVASKAKGIYGGNAAAKLNGQKVAVPLGSMAEYVFKETMKVVGADISKMKIISMNPKEGAAALNNGDVAMACLYGANSINAALTSGERLLTVQEARDAEIVGIAITSVTNKFLKENPGMVRTFLEITHKANARYKSGKSDISIIAKDTKMSLSATKAYMSGFEFPDTYTIKSKYTNDGGILMRYIAFLTSGNSALKNYSKVVDTSYLPDYVYTDYVYKGPDTIKYLDQGIPDRVFFATNKSSLTTEYRETLIKQAEWLRNNTSINIVLEGHTDERGTRAYNSALGERRANSAKDYLITYGISSNRISVISYGKERPVNPGSNALAWSQNRRVVTVKAN
jgi:taurine transport system substrate-binding protein